jgi:hypothetical protein
VVFGGGLFAASESAQRAARMPAGVLLAGQTFASFKRYRKRTKNVDLGEDARARNEVQFPTFVIDTSIQEYIRRSSEFRFAIARDGYDPDTGLTKRLYCR